jgi:hypothetical protein
MLPAVWKSALVNNDWCWLEIHDPDAAAKAKAWQIETGLTVVSCGTLKFNAQYDGTVQLCRKYYCHSPKQDRPSREDFDRAIKSIECGTSSLKTARTILQYVEQLEMRPAS